MVVFKTHLLCIHQLDVSLIVSNCVQLSCTAIASLIQLLPTSYSTFLYDIFGTIGDCPMDKTGSALRPSIVNHNLRNNSNRCGNLYPTFVFASE